MTASSELLQNRQASAVTHAEAVHDSKNPNSQCSVKAILSQKSNKSKIPSSDSLDDKLQPNPLEKHHQNSHAATSTQGLSNTTIRASLDPTVPALGAAKAQKAEIPAHSGPSHVKSTVKLEFLAHKGYPDSTKMLLDSFYVPDLMVTSASA